MWGKWIALLVALMVATQPIGCCGTAHAQNAADGATTTNKTFTLGGGQTPGAGATKKTMFYVDADGYLRVIDAAPDALQSGNLVILSASATPANKGYSATSIPYTLSSQNAWKWVRVTTTGGTAASPWKVQFLGSPDGVTYGYLTAGASGSVLGSSTPTFVESDTLEIRGHGTGTWWAPLDTYGGFPVTLKFLQCRGVNDTTAAAISFTVEIAGRQH